MLQPSGRIDSNLLKSAVNDSEFHIELFTSFYEYEQHVSACCQIFGSFAFARDSRVHSGLPTRREFRAETTGDHLHERHRLNRLPKLRQLSSPRPIGAVQSPEFRRSKE